MSSKKYEPFINLSGLDRLQDEIGRVFSQSGFNWDDFNRDDVTSGATTRWRPAVDIVESDDHYVIVADIPGVNSDSINVELSDGVMTVSGFRENQSLDSAEYKRQERQHGEFYRRFTLPKTADADSVVARSDDGVLTITVQKKESTQSRKIHVVKDQ